MTDREPGSDAEVVAVVIIGAGPVGVSAATLLAQRGVESLIVEQHADVYPLPRAVHIDDETYRTLQQLGISEEFSSISRSMPGMRLYDARHVTMGEFVRDEVPGLHGYPQANMFDQPDLEALLRENLAAYPLAQLRTSTEMIAIEQGIPNAPAPVRVTLREVETGREYQVWTRALLGCDGANSTTREIIGATLLDLGYEERWLVVDVRSNVPLDAWDGLHQVCDPARAATYMRIGPDRYRWEFQLRDGEDSEDLVRPDRLAVLLAPWLKDIPLESTEVLRRAEYTFRARIADRWRDGRVFLLGDAAHLTPPFIGQGLCAGLRDAANLTWKLALVLAGGADERLLDSYAQERWDHARTVVRAAVLVGWAMTGGQDKAAAFRRPAVSAAVRIPLIRGKILESIAPPLKRGAFVRRPRLSPRSVCGTQIPQPWVEFGGVRRRLDDVLGDGWAVVLVDALSDELRGLAARMGAVTVRVVRAADGSPSTPAPGELVVVDSDDVLVPWFRGARSGAVVVRPDRVVLASAKARGGRPVGADIVTDSVHWTPLLPVEHRRPFSGRTA